MLSSHCKCLCSKRPDYKSDRAGEPPPSPPEGEGKNEIEVIGYSVPPLGGNGIGVPLALLLEEVHGPHGLNFNI